MQTAFAAAVKLAVDRQFATRPEREQTVIMGSSMGGLISIYPMNGYPQVFGGAAGLFKHWMGSFEANAQLPLAAFHYLRDHLVPAGRHRLYMDHGTTELDALYAPYQALVNEIVRDKGYAAADSLTRISNGTGHNERDWAARLAIPLRSLLGVSSGAQSRHWSYPLSLGGRGSKTQSAMRRLRQLPEPRRAAAASLERTVETVCDADFQAWHFGADREQTHRSIASGCASA